MCGDAQEEAQRQAAEALRREVEQNRGKVLARKEIEDEKLAAKRRKGAYVVWRV
jgi:hypothetical protein